MPEDKPLPRFRSLDEDLFEYELYDRLADVTHCLFHRLPTTAERASYRSRAIIIEKKGKDRRVIAAADMTPLNKHYGMLLCTGFKKGTFGVGKGEDARLISSDPEAPDYHKGWKALIDKALPNAFAGLGWKAMNPEGKAAEEGDDSGLEEASLDEIAKMHGYGSLEDFLADDKAGQAKPEGQEDEPEPPLANSSGD